MRIHSATSTIVAVEASVPVGSLTVHASPGDRDSHPHPDPTEVSSKALAERATDHDGTVPPRDHQRDGDQAPQPTP